MSPGEALAEARIEELEAEIERLRKALSAIAEFGYTGPRQLALDALSAESSGV